MVRGDRVNGTLAVSRALGDFQLKRNDALAPEAQMVSPEPDVTSTQAFYMYPLQYVLMHLCTSTTAS
jgi:hypothetical protein